MNSKLTPIDEIKQKLNIVDLVSSYVDIKKAGRNYKGLCPFHGEKTSSFMVSAELQIFKCFGCGESGDLFTFHQKIEGLDFRQSLEQLADRADVKLPKSQNVDPNKGKKKLLYELNALAAQYYNYILTKHSVGKEPLSYLLEARKLTDKTIEEFNLGYAPDTWDGLYKFLLNKKYKPEDILAAGLSSKSKRGNYIDKFRGRIMVPFIDLSGKVIGFTGRAFGDFNPKYLNSPETIIFNKSMFLYGLEKSKVEIKQKGAVFVEGQFDVISSYQAGIKNVIATSGTSLTMGQLKILKRYTDSIIFAFDSDTAGDAAIRRAIALAEKENFHVSVGLIPGKYQDLDDIIKEDPKEAKRVLRETIPVFDYFLVSALKRNNPKSPIGKKKVMAELIPIFKKITDPVLKDHYIKKIAHEVFVTEIIVADLLSGKDEKGEYSRPSTSRQSKDPLKIFSKKTLEEYILALVFNAPLDIAQTVLYKLGQKDFTNHHLLEIFTDLKKYLLGRKRKFEIQHFAKRFDEDLKNTIDDLFLWDLQEVVDKEGILEKELERVFRLIKKGTAKRELRELSTKIKQAELAKDKDLLTELTLEFKELSEKLL